MKRGEIYWCDLTPVVGSEQGGFRPALVISTVKNSPIALIAPISSKTKKKMSVHTPISKDCGFVRDGIVLCEQLRTVDKSRMHGYIGSADAPTMQKVIETIVMIVGA